MHRGNMFLNRVALASLLFIASGFSGGSARAQTGGDLYKAKCAVCHGPDGKGDTGMGRANKLRDLGSADVQSQNDDTLTGIITNGKNKMPAYGKSLKAEQIKDLVTFLRTLKK